MNSSLAIISWKIFSLCFGFPRYFLSGLAIARATLVKSCAGDSIILSFSSLKRYLCLRTSRALTVSLGSSMPSFARSFRISSFFSLKD